MSHAGTLAESDSFLGEFGRRPTWMARSPNWLVAAAWIIPGLVVAVALPVAGILSALFAIGSLSCLMRGDLTNAVQGLSYLTVTIGVVVLPCCVARTVFGSLDRPSKPVRGPSQAMWDSEIDLAFEFENEVDW